MTEAITDRPDGVRVVQLFMPFDHEGVNIKSIALGPIIFDLTLKWQAGEFKNSVQLLCAVAHCDEALLRQVRYPDVDRILEQFMAMLPGSVREDIMGGGVPRIGTPEPSYDETPKPEVEAPAPEPEAHDDTGLGVDALNPQGV